MKFSNWLNLPMKSSI